MVRTRDHISPRQGRDLERVMNFVAARPDFLDGIIRAVDKNQQAQNGAHAAAAATHSNAAEVAQRPIIVPL